MIHEISQLDIPDRQLLASDAQPRAGTWTEIGEAEITHTIFGRAKVRIIRKHDKTRRARLLTALVLAALAVAAWQGWIASQQTESLQNADPLSAGSAKVQVSAPAVQPENIEPPAAPAIVENKSGTPPQAEISKPAISRKSAAQQSPDLKGDGQKAAKPVTVRQQPIAAQPKPVPPQPLATGKPQTTPLAADNNALKNQTDKPLPPKLSPPKPPVAPAVAVPHDTQPAASGPADFAPLASPIVKEDTTAQSPAGDKQPAEPVNAQSK